MILTKPTIEYEAQIRAYRQAFLDRGDSMDGTSSLRRFEDPGEWIAYVNAQADPATLPEGRVPAAQYLYVRETDGRVVGMIDLRFAFNPYLERYGGNVGYSVAPDERRKGYATQMLAEALPRFRERGIGRVLITCIKGNEGSRRVILKNGGVYESTVFEPDERLELERYWIDMGR